ncbi:MAG: hypothetical protein IJ093_00225 [Bacilli bacterium]|nr:hypothetical protein [Bacilli bacterium]
MKKNIPSKNYIILAVLIVVTICAVFYARSWYNTTKNYNTHSSAMLTVVNEINPNEISNYILESSNFVLYASSGQNTKIKSFERTFKNYVVKQGLSDNMLYISTDGYTKEELTNILRQYADSKTINKINVNDNASMYIFENQKIIHVINDANLLSIKEINVLLKSFGATGND